MTWNEVLESSHTEVIVESYGYTEFSSFSSHFEPFARKRKFTFHISRCDTPEYSMLEHPWLFLDENENELEFIEKGGKLYLNDPDLSARQSY